MLHKLNNVIDDIALKQGRHPVNFICVMDFSGMNWSRTYNNIAPFMKNVACMDLYFPERLNTCLILRVPRLFSGIYKLATPY